MAEEVRPSTSRVRLLLAAVAILAVTLVVYRQVIFPPDPAARYPWSSDTWGHLIKAEYLLEQVRQGHWYPDLFPYWYSGQQMLRYYAPLPYYILMALLVVTGDVFAAGNWTLFLAALAGGLSMLLFARWYGLGWATVGGVLLVLLPDNLRVAFAEGNLPRILAAALLPAAFFCLLDILSSQRPRMFSFLGLAVLVSLIVLSHAMMGAIFSVCMLLFVLVYWVLARASFGSVRRAVLGVLAGVLLSGWWLLPSLTGGITDLNAEAASEALASFPWSVSFNPALRASNREAFYVGASFLLALGLMLAWWRRLDALSRTLLVIGSITLLVSSTLLNDIYNSLPFHQLFWPLRFMSFAGFVLVLASVALLRTAWQASGPRRESAGRFLALGLVLVMALDFWQSVPLAHTREAPQETEQVASMLRDSPGWRVAVADLSRLGSAPSYLFTAVGGREQVYGWAYQGAATAPLLAMVNQAMEKGFTAYAVDRLQRLGADDVVVLNGLPLPGFRQGLEDAGYRRSFRGQQMDVYHRDGVPRAYRANATILAIGTGGQNLSLLFPGVLAASSPTLDSYDLEFLARFDTLVLAGFDWRSRARAEEMVKELAARGKRVIIDLTGTPLDSLSRTPRFLDVYGEPVLLSSPPLLLLDDGPERLQPFDPAYDPWLAFVPQGLDSRELGFQVQSVRGTVIGTRRTGEGQVTFLGLNLVFHAVLTHDPLAIQIVEGLLGVPASQAPPLEWLPMRDYSASQSGYRFSLDVPGDGYYLLPLARHAGTAVYVDGQPVPSVAVEALALVRLPAGQHQVEVRSLRTSIYRAGVAATGLGLVVACVVALSSAGMVGGILQASRGLRVPAPWGWRP